MNPQCSNAVLESALAGSLPADDEVSLHRHLEECEECSAALERMAGGTAWCQEAASLLTRDELDAAVPTLDEWSEVDFTVEHLEPADEPNVLGRLGGYDVLEIIGHGGMGVVLKGFDRELKRCVAIKVLAPHLAQSSLAKKRFAREAQAAAAVVHPHVLAIHQVQPNGRLPFLVMPLVAGESLAQRLTAQGTLELKEILRIGMQAAAGLAAAHEQGLVHRDVKPANILLEKGVERAVLTDFGLARAADDVSMTRWGIIAGTPQYMSPEQPKGESLDGRSDLFSLGCVLYEMATGVSPFRTDSTMATMRRLVDDSPQARASLNPELPPWFIAIVGRLLEKEPSKRFGSAKEVSELLEECLAHLQQPASVPLPPEIPASSARRVSFPRISRLTGVIAMSTALGIGLLGFALLTAEPSDIAGEWSGEEWGQVVLKKTADAEYAGTYSDTLGKQPGELQLKWSRIERRFNGTWREGEDRFGKISLRVINQEIRGAHTTDPKSKINPGTPRLADLAWSRVKETVPREAASATKAASEIPMRNVPMAVADIAPGTVITETHLGQGPFPVDKLGRDTLLVNRVVVGRVAKELIKAAQPIHASQLYERPSTRRTEPVETRLWNVFGVTSAPVLPLTAKVLEWIGLHLRPITKDGFRDKNVFAKYPGGLDLTFVRTHGPAEKAGIHDVDIIVRLQGRQIASLENLDVAMQDAVGQMKRGDADSLQFDVLRSGETIRVNVPLAVSQLGEEKVPGTVESSTAAGQKTKRSARDIVEAYVAAALAGRAGDAFELVVSGKSPGQKKQIEEFKTMLAVESLKIPTVHVSDGKGRAVAVSEKVKITRPSPARRTAS